MGKNDKNALKSNLRILLMHLLKYKYQPDKRTNSWKYTIIEHRIRLEDTFKKPVRVYTGSLKIFLMNLINMLEN